jgi:hypothetical protein
MNCADAEILICDYVDGVLSADQKSEVERHLAQCPVCAELARDSAAGLAFMERAAEVEPPQELITRILFDAPWSKGKPKQAAWRKWMGGILSPILQPKFAMGMAMTILSLSMLFKFASPSLKPADWKPSRILATMEDRVSYGWGRTVKFYENLKFVYQIQNTLRQWQQQQSEEQRPAAETSDQKADDHKLPQKSSPARTGTAPSSNSTGVTH